MFEESLFFYLAPQGRVIIPATKNPVRGGRERDVAAPWTYKMGRMPQGGRLG